jgi:exodeoxyribonuclease-5
LKEVVRQSKDSSILTNATLLRSGEELAYPQFSIDKGGDVVRLDGEDTQDCLESSIGNFGQEETIIITRSNKRANLYNNHIRARVFWFEEDLCGGDLLMAVKNNYYWLPDNSSMGFIANGEMMKVKRVGRREELYGFNFATIQAEFVDYPQEGEHEIIVMMDTLQAESPNLPREDMKRLFFEIEKDYANELNKKKRYDKILKDPYFNALQIKYAYAVTCHKSQGGQWAHVYIDQGYLTEEMLDEGYFRWLYTAFTRATERVFLMNFNKEFFPGGDL